MSMVRWDPFLEMGDMGERVRALLGGGVPAGIATAPVPVDVYETADAYVVHAALPGVRPEDVQVEMRSGELAIRATRVAEAPDGGKPILRELANGEFTRVIGFPTLIDRDGVTAGFTNGRLAIRVPKAETARPRVVEVRPEA